ncbi:MotA/TolQ/ExbB proton channel family protein [bacterium]|nr:MotA/TolQ/ExbB proton channel family protein [bacterium]
MRRRPGSRLQRCFTPCLFAVAIACGGPAFAQERAPVSAEPPAPARGSDVSPNVAAAPRTEPAQGASAPGTGTITAPPGAPNPETLLDRRRIAELISVENPMIWPMILCSIVALGYFLDRWFSLRRGRIVPREFVNRFLDRLGSGKLDRERALDLCKANDSPAARVFSQILLMWGEPAGQIRAGIGQAIGAEYVNLRRNIRVLNATASLAPLIGLLGTVVGIIESFNALGSKNVTSKSAALAEGIGLALVMTALGLVVAIASVTAYYYLLGKLDASISALEQESVRVMELVAGQPGRAGGDRRGHIEMSRGIDSRIA